MRRADGVITSHRRQLRSQTGSGSRWPPVAPLALALTATSAVTRAQGAPITILNVSYDPTRELYREFNAAFAKYWKSKTGQTVTVRASHGGSGSQARAVIDGLEADVVTLALAFDVDAIANAGLTDKGWQKRLPNNSTPYTSTIVFLVRKGNPEEHQGLGRPRQAGRPGHHAEPEDVRRRAVELPGRVAVRADAAWRQRHDRARVRDALYKNVPVLDSGARGSTNTFAQRGIGDVLLAWENEAYLALAESQGTARHRRAADEHPRRAAGRRRGQGRRQARHDAPSPRPISSILGSPEGQEIAAKHHYRPRDPNVAARSTRASFAEVKLFTINEAFGGWQAANKTHFADGASSTRSISPAQVISGRDLDDPFCATLESARLSASRWRSPCCTWR